MPNLVPPVDSVEAARQYRDRIAALVPKESAFEPMMTLYLTRNTTPTVIREAKKSGFVKAFKLYPAGATTNSEAGIDSIKSLYPLFEVMQAEKMPLAIHGEVTDAQIDIFDREAVFIDRYLRSISETFPALQLILEHITTSDAVDFVEAAGPNVAATITVHHLLYNRNDMLAGSIKPLYYCLPVLKRNTHQHALLKAATGGNSKFFLGTDSAPHPRSSKENACGCAAGAYTAHAAIELYAEVFDQVDALHMLEGFASFFGADFYQIPRNTDTITLQESSWTVPEWLLFGDEQLIPIRTGAAVAWRVS
jgi:dihydroorotase